MTTPTPRTDRDFPEGALHLRTTDEFMARIRQQERDLAARDAELAALTLQFSEMRRRWQLRDLYATQQEERAEAAEQLAAQRLTDVEIAERHADTATAAMHAAERERDDERTIVNRIWEQLGAPSYASLSGRSIYDLIAGLQADRDEWKRKAEEAARDSARLDFLLKLWPLEIVRLIHSHHTHGPSSSIPREAIDAAIAAKGEE